jgi:hypothetical protein
MSLRQRIWAGVSWLGIGALGAVLAFVGFGITLQHTELRSWIVGPVFAIAGVAIAGMSLQGAYRGLRYGRDLVDYHYPYADITVRGTSVQMPNVCVTCGAPDGIQDSYFCHAGGGMYVAGVAGTAVKFEASPVVTLGFAQCVTCRRTTGTDREALAAVEPDLVGHADGLMRLRIRNAAFLRAFIAANAGCTEAVAVQTDEERRAADKSWNQATRKLRSAARAVGRQ